MAKRERMSPVDTAWLRMDSPRNLMMIVGVYQFEGRVDFERLRSLLLAHFVVHRRFRSRVEQDPSGYYWQEVEHFDIDFHLARTALPGKGTVADLQKLAGRLASQSLDFNKPLWQMHVVDNVAGGQAMVVRIHHCIADGISLIGVLLALSSESASREDDDDPRDAGQWDAYLRPWTEATVRALGMTGDVAARVMKVSNRALAAPERVGEVAGNYARIAARVASDAAELATMDNDTTTSLKGKPGGSKVVAWNEPLSLDEVKAVGKALDCSVNDVLLASVAGALRSYLVSRGESVEGAELRAMVPVNLRDPKRWRDLGNKFGLVPLLLPVGIANPIARVYEVRRRMSQLKDGYTAVIAMGLLGAVGLGPKALQQQALDFLARKSTAVMTNVPGPQLPLYLAGARVARMMFWVPQSGDIGVGVSILSYAGGVQFGLITDKRLCPHPQQIIDRFAPEFEQLVHALCLLPWGEAVDADAAERALFGGAADGDASVPSAPEASGAVPPPGVRRRKSAFAAARAS